MDNEEHKGRYEKSVLLGVLLMRQNISVLEEPAPRSSWINLMWKGYRLYA